MIIAIRIVRIRFFLASAACMDFAPDSFDDITRIMQRQAKSVLLFDCLPADWVGDLALHGVIEAFRFQIGDGVAGGFEPLC